MEKISVAIPTHNRASLLEEALESVYSQTLLPNEVIVAEDGRDNKTLEIIQRYQNKNKNIQLVHFVNDPPLKQLKNRQLAISSTTGDYIAMLDDDDKWDIHFLEKTYLALTKSKLCDFCSTDHYFMNEHGDVLMDNSMEFSKYCGRDRMKEGEYNDVFLRVISNKASIYSLQHTLFRRKALEEVGFFQPFGEMVPDFMLFLTLGLHRKISYYIPERLGYCRIHSGQQTNQRLTNSQDRVEGLLSLYKKNKEQFQGNEFKIFKEKYGVSVLERSIAYLHEQKRKEAVAGLGDLHTLKSYRLPIQRVSVYLLLLLGVRKRK